jgi:hypothetical protein
MPSPLRSDPQSRTKDISGDANQSQKRDRSEDANQFPFRGVCPIDGMFDRDQEELGLLRLMVKDAEDYIQGFNWCKGIREAYFGGGYGGVLAVILFRIVPSRPEVDEWLWVVVGDLPPAYLVTDVSKSPSQALMSYVREMTKWIQLIKRGRRSDDVIEVNLAPTWENAAALEERLKIIRDAIVPALEEREAALG